VGIIRDLARQGKDKAVSKALEVLGEAAVSRYGTLLGIELDSSSRTIVMEVMLKGEDSPVTVTVHEYRFVANGDRSSVVIGRVSVSREWLEIMARDHLTGRELEIPSRYAKLLSALF
jgi:hypothetical protein